MKIYKLINFLSLILLLFISSCKKSDIFVTFVTITPSTKDLYVGDTFQLTATVNPSDATDKTLSWSSSNGNVAVDQAGNISAIKEGTATITATAIDGSKVKATCVVNVQNKVKKVTSITITPSTKDLYVGDTFQLTATVNPSDATDKTLSWSSSNGNVAVDQAGNISAIKEGTATITATAIDGSKVKATCVVNVQNKVKKVTSITITPSTKDLYVGDTFQLTATVNPSDATDKTLSWSSSNGNVEVDQAGNISAIKEGTATITATAIDGSKVKATCVVNVQNKVKKVTSITITPSTKDLYVGDTFQLTATVNPSDATDKTLSWSSSNGNVTIDQSGNIMAIREGATIITATAIDGSRVKATCNLTIQQKVLKTSSYYQWDAYASCDYPDTGKWEPNSSHFHDGKDITATQSCKDCPSFDEMRLYLGVDVYWDEDGPGYTLPNGEIGHKGLWIMKKKFIPNDTKRRVWRTPILGKPADISQYFFLPACGYCEPDGSIIFYSEYGYYWLKNSFKGAPPHFQFSITQACIGGSSANYHYIPLVSQ